MSDTPSAHLRQVYVDAHAFRQVQLVAILQGREIEDVVEDYTCRGIHGILAEEPSLRTLIQLPRVRGAQTNHCFSALVLDGEKE